MNDKKEKEKCNIGKNRRRFEAIFLSRTIKEGGKIIRETHNYEGTKTRQLYSFHLEQFSSRGQRKRERERDSRFEHNSLSVSNRFQLKYKAVVTINTHISALKP